MAHGLLRSVVIFAGMFLLGGCAAFPEYRVMLQWNPDDFDYTLWVCDESGCVSSLQYNVSFSHLLKTYRRGEGVLELEPLEEGNEPEFFDLFRNGKRYLLIQDSGGGARGPFYLRVIEFDAAGWRQIHYGDSGELPQLDDVDGDGRFEFRHAEFFPSPLPPVCGELYGVLILAYSDGKLLPDRRLNQMPPMTPEELSELKRDYRTFIQETENESTHKREEIEAHFIKGALIDLLYGGNWNRSGELIRVLEYDPASGERLKREILAQVRNSPYYDFLMELNRGDREN